MDKDFSKLEDSLKTVFQNKKLLNQAFVHRSYLNENPDFELDHNERLEFLGDAVLELVVTEFLYRNYENPEGELTNWRSSLVNSKKLAEISGRLGFDKFLYLSRGEQKDVGKARDYILGNTFESVVGAMYLDQGIEPARVFIERELVSELEEIIAKGLHIDPKSKFQEIAQEKLRVTPEYKVLAESGPDHNRVFKVGVYIGEENVGEGEGSSKQHAEIKAAEDALKRKNWE